MQHATFRGTPCGLGILPDGSVVVLMMLDKQLAKYCDGELSIYADLSQIAAGAIDDMIIDGFGRAFVGDLGFELPPPADRPSVGRLILVLPSREVPVVADGLRFPNGIAVASDHRRLLVAEMEGECLVEYNIQPQGALSFCRRFGRIKAPDGICLDSNEAA